MQAYFSQFEHKINILLREGKIQEAYSLCLQKNKEHPNSKDLMKLRKRVEEEIKRHNQEIIEEKMEKIHELENSQKFAEVLRELKPLLKADPDNKKLQKLYKKNKEKYLNTLKDLQQNFNKQQRSILKDLLEKNPAGFIEHIYELEKNNPDNPDIHELCREFRGLYIENKLEEKKELIYSDKFEDITHLLNDLRKIDYENPKLQEIEYLVNKRKRVNQIEEKKEYIYRGEVHLSRLIRMKKYDMAIILANEILEIDKKNKKVQKALKKAEDKYFKISSKGVIEKILKSLPALKKEYKSDKDSYTKL